MAEEIRVLHVDDDPQFVTLVSTFLERERESLSTATVTSADDGIEYLAENEVDCVVSDYDMPSMNGLAFLESIREAGWDVPFILYTGKGSEEIASEAISAGVSDYLQKESGTSQYTVLANRITNVVEQSRAKREAKATERRLTEFAENVDDILYMFDAAWEEVLFINSTYEELWGGSTAELEADARSFLEYVHPDDRAAVRQAMTTVSNGEPSDAKYRVRFTEDDYRWVRAHSQPVFDDDGTVNHVVGYAREISDEVRRKRELDTERERMQFAMDVTSSYAFETDLDTGAVVRYGAFEALYNLSPDDVPTLDAFIERAVHPDDRELIEAIHEGNSVGDLEKETVEFRTNPATGPVRWLRVTVYRDETDRTMSGLVTDITEEKAHEIELREEKAFIEGTLDSLSDQLYVTDESGRVVRWNESVPEVTGYDEAEIQDIEAIDIVPPEERDAVSEAIATVFETGLATVETDLLTADGDRIPHEFRATTLNDVGDETLLVGIGRDVSDRVAREAELRRSKRRFEAIFNDPNILVGLLDPDGCVIEANERAINVIEQPLEAVVGDPFWKTPWWDDDTRDRVEHLVRQAAGGEYRSFQAEHTTAAGERLVVEGVFRPVVDADGTVTSIFISARDITEREMHRRELELQAEKRAEFVGFLSHDMQNPIASIEGWLDLALETGDPAHIEKARDSLARVDELREDLMTTLQSGMVADEDEPVQLDGLAETIWERIDPPDAGSLDVTEPITIDGDPNAIQRLLENLVSNSIEHGPADVSIRLDAFDGGFCYEDDGPGIPESDREAVFSPGYSSKHDGELAGMGMASVREIVHGHGWSIAVTDPEELDGVRFEIQTGA